MNWYMIKGNWRYFKDSIKSEWRKITDNDLLVIDGNRDRLVGKIQQHYGLPRDHAEDEVDSWRRRVKLNKQQLGQ
ncbi:MAG TPA: CsbD family protein [Gammaproteobacteria bacterium]